MFLPIVLFWCTGLVLQFNYATGANTTGESVQLCQRYPADKFTKALAAVMPNKTVTVRASLLIIKINNVDSIGQRVDLIVLSRLSWYDNRFYDEARLPCPPLMINTARKIWHPMVILLNAAQEINYGSIKEEAPYISHMGFVSWEVAQAATVSCNFNVRWFPFDKQDCELYYGIPSYPRALQSSNGYSVNLVQDKTTPVNTAINYNVYSAQSAYLPTWQLTAGCAHSSPDDPLPNLHYRFRIERKPSWTLWTLGMPTVLTSVIMAIAFLLRADSGDKVTFGMTVLLTYFLLLFAVVAEVPASSKNVPVFLYFMVILLLTSSVAVFACCLLRKFANSEDQRKQKLAKKYNSFSFVTYTVVTVTEYVIFLVVLALHSDPTSGHKDEGTCTFSNSTNILKPLKSYFTWLFEPNGTPPAVFLAG